MLTNEDTGEEFNGETIKESMPEKKPEEPNMLLPSAAWPFGDPMANTVETAKWPFDRPYEGHKKEEK